MLIREYRIVLPLTVDEYQVGQLYSVAEASKLETGGGEGIEVLVNEPFEDEATGRKGQYTHKVWHLSQKVPAFIRLLAPAGALELHEKAWNAYPYCKTVMTNEYMKDKFSIVLETMHLADAGTTENALNLEGSALAKREVSIVDIAVDPVHPKDYKADEDPTLVKSEKTGRGPLAPGWISTSEPVMCAYKVVSAEFKWFGLQSRVEAFIQRTNAYLLNRFHRQVCLHFAGPFPCGNSRAPC